MCHFLIDALDFIHFEELPDVLRNFEEYYEGNICKLFAMLCIKLQLWHYSEQEQKKVKVKWIEQAKRYLEIKNPSVNAEDHIRRKLIEFATKMPSRQALQEQAQELVGRKRCDVSTLMQICDNFVASMACYASDFAEQKIVLIDDATFAKHYETKTVQAVMNGADSKKEA